MELFRNYNVNLWYLLLWSRKLPELLKVLPQNGQLWLIWISLWWSFIWTLRLDLYFKTLKQYWHSNPAKEEFNYSTVLLVSCDREIYDFSSYCLSCNSSHIPHTQTLKIKSSSVTFSILLISCLLSCFLIFSNCVSVFSWSVEI